MDTHVINLLKGHTHRHRDTADDGVHIQYRGPDDSSIIRTIKEAEFFGHYSMPHVAGLSPDATLRELSQRTAVWDVLTRHSRANSQCGVVPESRNKHCIELVTDNQPKACTARRMIHAIATNAGLRLRFHLTDPLFSEPLALNFEFERPNHSDNFDVDLLQMFEEVAFDVPAKLFKDYGTTYPAVLKALAVASVINGRHRLANDCFSLLLLIKSPTRLRKKINKLIEGCLSIYDRLINAAREAENRSTDVDAEAVNVHAEERQTLTRWRNLLQDMGMHL